MVEGSDGTLYGTTKYGGIPGGGALEAFGMSDLGNGTVFKVNKDGNGYGLLRSFTCRGGDGSMPHAGLVEGRDGQMYGTTFDGGSKDNGVYPGTVFTLSHDGSRYQVLYSYGTNAALGARPWADLMAGSDGSLYRTTDASGAGGHGTVFKLNTNGSGYTVLHSFPDRRGDGRMPRSSVVEGLDGALYGTTTTGGTEDGGIVFRVNKDGTDYRVLYDFKHNGPGGGIPQGLAQGSDGALYGTTESGGTNRGGTAFKLSPDGSGFRVLHSFPGFAGDGVNPQGTLVKGSDGALYGMTRISSTNNSATVFRLSEPGLAPKVPHGSK